MGILQDRLKEQRSETEATDKRVAGTQALRPTDDEQEAADAVIRAISEKFKREISQSGFTDGLQSEIKGEAAREADKIMKGAPYEQKARVLRLVMSTIVGLGPIEIFMLDPAITDIIVQRYDNVCVEKGGKIERTEAEFVSEASLVSAINRIVQAVGRQVNTASPRVDARLKDGSRVNATIPPISPDGATLTIRKFPEKTYSGEDYLNFGSLDERMLEFLGAAVKGRCNLIVSGGTGSGKTTLLNMLSAFIPEDELIVTIEDSCELRLAQKNVRRLESRHGTDETRDVTIQELVKNSLRMRPDRIIVGEIRDGTVVDMFSAMSTGHDGSMSTVHANSPENLVNARLPILYSQYRDGSFTPEGQRAQIAEALNLIVQIERLKDGTRKLTRVTHVDGLDERGRVRLSDVFRYNRAEGRFEACGYVPKSITERLSDNGTEIDTGLFDKTHKTEGGDEL
jgi:Flp pilus assembly CpaF family ATPase